jgi:hypothetical protein
MKPRKLYLKYKSRSNTGKFLKRHFHKRTCRRANKKLRELAKQQTSIPREFAEIFNEVYWDII